jgi:hydroxymethylpyrimidine/phosphomethylpyrimidine kinase
MAPERIPRALSIAGSDPSGGAGLQLDLQVFACHGVHGMAVPTALTVQTTKAVERVLPVFPNALSQQLAALLADLRPDAIKIGMLGTDDIVLQVALLLERDEIPRIVDPVLQASDGSYLLERRAWPNLLKRLIAGAALVTPNLDEADALTGTRDPQGAAAQLLELGANAVLIKGGHATGPPDDLLATPGGSHWLRGTLQHGDPVHGTGCALSSAITARLARGESLETAVEGAKRFTERAIRHAYPAGSGARLLRLDHEGQRDGE